MLQCDWCGEQAFFNGFNYNWLRPDAKEADLVGPDVRKAACLVHRRDLVAWTKVDWNGVQRLRLFAQNLSRVPFMNEYAKEATLIEARRQAVMVYTNRRLGKMWSVEFPDKQHYQLAVGWFAHEGYKPMAHASKEAKVRTLYFTQESVQRMMTDLWKLNGYKGPAPQHGNEERYIADTVALFEDWRISATPQMLIDMQTFYNAAISEWRSEDKAE